MISREIKVLIVGLEAIDFGLVDQMDDVTREATLRRLERIVDYAADLGIDTQAGDLAIRYFLTDPQKSRTYLYGPTDIQDGVGFVEQLRSVVS